MKAIRAVGTGSAGGVGGEVDVAARAIPVAGHGLGVECSLHVVQLAHPVQQESRHPQLVRAVNANAGAHLPPTRSHGKSTAETSAFPQLATSTTSRHTMANFFCEFAFFSSFISFIANQNTVQAFAWRQRHPSPNSGTGQYNCPAFKSLHSRLWLADIAGCVNVLLVPASSCLPMLLARQSDTRQPATQSRMCARTTGVPRASDSCLVGI